MSFNLMAQSPSAVNLDPKKIKSVIVSPSIIREVIGLEAFCVLNFKPAFSLSSFTFI